MSPTLTKCVSIDALRKRSADLALGLNTIEKQSVQLRNDQLATFGAKQVIDQMITELEKAPEEAPPGELEAALIG